MKASTKSKIGLFCMALTVVIVMNGVIYLTWCSLKAFIIMDVSLLLTGLYVFGAWLHVGNTN